MGLKIDVTTVSRVLLKDGAWYEVLPGSLTMDAMEWTDTEGLSIPTEVLAADPAMGVRFKTRGMNGWIACPLTSVKAVHYEPIELEDPLAVSIPAVLADELDQPPR
jgi:hypothetical protein